MMFETSKHIPKTKKHCCVFKIINNISVSVKFGIEFSFHVSRSIIP